MCDLGYSSQLVNLRTVVQLAPVEQVGLRFRRWDRALWRVLMRGTYLLAATAAIALMLQTPVALAQEKSDTGTSNTGTSDTGSSTTTPAATTTPPPATTSPPGQASPSA